MPPLMITSQKTSLAVMLRNPSIAIRYRLRADDRTLERNEIEDERSKFVAAAAALGATLRGT